MKWVGNRDMINCTFRSYQMKFPSLRKWVSFSGALSNTDNPMANTYTQIYIQVVFAVEARQCLILPERKEELQKYMTGIVTGQGQKLLSIACMPDHTHVLVGLRPTMSLSDLVQEIKMSASKFINGRHWVPGRFSWQEGFGAFSYGHSQIGVVMRYINNQEEHHQRQTLREEYIKFLRKYEIDHDERFIFREI
jgi:putative transposase